MPMMKLEFAGYGYMGRCRDSCTIFGYVLRKRFEQLRIKDDSVVGLSEFDADKTMRLLDKLAEERAADLLSAFKGSPPREFQTRILTFPVNRNYSDKHGHRIAFEAARETPLGPTRVLKPVLDVIHSFDARCSLAERILVVREAEERWGTIKYLEPQVSSASLAPLLRSGTIDKDDISFFARFGESCGVLDDREIEAIGRHETPNDTQDSLLSEFARWHEKTQEAFDALSLWNSNSTPGETDELSRKVWEAWSFALESRKKASLPLSDLFPGDREAYERALYKFRTELSDSSHSTEEQKEANQRLLRYLDRSQPDANEIWSDPIVSVLQFPAFCIWSFSNYFCGTLKGALMFKGTILERRLSSVSKEDVENAGNNVRRILDVPRTSGPTKFSATWWNSLGEPGGGGLFGQLVLPSQLWNQEKNLTEFVTASRNVFDWVWKEHLDPVTWGRRVQAVP